jgi:hypothetical protein
MFCFRDNNADDRSADYVHYDRRHHYHDHNDVTVYHKNGYNLDR